MKIYNVKFLAEYYETFTEEEIPAGMTPEEYAEEIWTDNECNINGHETEIHEAKQDQNGAELTFSNGRYFNRLGEFGYNTHLTGAYVCYTCGHLCECSEAYTVDTDTDGTKWMKVRYSVIVPVMAEDEADALYFSRLALPDFVVNLYDADGEIL